MYRQARASNADRSPAALRCIKSSSVSSFNIGFTWAVIVHLTRVGDSSHAAAAGPAQYRRFHAALYSGGRVSPETIAAAGRAAGVDPSRIPADADAEIGRNLEIAGALNLSGTPSWVVGDRVLSGAQPLDALEAAVKAARSR